MARGRYSSRVRPAAAWLLCALAAPAGTAAQPPQRRIDLQALIDQSDVIRLEAGDWLIDRHVRINRPNVRIECPNGLARIVTIAGGGERELPIIDATGAYGLTLSNLAISTFGDARAQPAGAGLYLARDEKLSPMSARLDNVQIYGKFRVAALVNVAGEASGFYNCIFRNLQPGGHAVLLTARPPQRLPVRSAPQPQTCLQNAFFNCSLGVSDPFAARSDGSACLAIESLDGDVVGDVTLFGGGFSAKQPGSYGILIRCHGRGGHVNSIHLYGLRAECNDCEAVIRVDQPDGQSVGHLTWNGGSAVFSGRFLHVTGEYAISHWRIEGLHLSGGLPDVPVVQVPHTQYCRFELSSTTAPWPLLIEKSTRADQIRVQRGKRIELPRELRGTRLEQD